MKNEYKVFAKFLGNSEEKNWHDASWDTIYGDCPKIFTNLKLAKKWAAKLNKELKSIEDLKVDIKKYVVEKL